MHDALLYFQTDTQTQLIISTYDSVCGSVAQCTDAQQALNADSNCTTAIGSDDSASYCSETCVALVKNVVDSCPDVCRWCIDLITYIVTQYKVVR